MTWFGNSFSNLKDQITTLTREVLAEADEDAEQPKFIPTEKFNRLLKICEEKEEQICQLQQEIDTLRGQGARRTSSASAEGAEVSEHANDGSGDGGEEGSDAKSNFDQQEGKSNSNRDDNGKSSPEHDVAQCSSPTDNDENSSDEKQIQFALQRIENVSGKNRLEHLHLVLKEVKSMYEAEKSLRSNESGGSSAAGGKIKPSTSVISFPSSKNSNGTGTDETMSNDSERSDDSLLNDFEILKPRNPCKSLEEYAMSNSGGAVSTRLTHSASTQSDYEFSVVEKSTQTCSIDIKSEANVDVDVAASAASSDLESRMACCTKKGEEFEQIFRSLQSNSQFWQEVFDRINAGRGANEDDICDDDDSTSSQRKFWIDLHKTVSQNNETLKNFVVALIDENELWKQFYQSLNENEENAKKRVDKLMERESSLEESIRQKNTAMVKHVNELNTYSKKLEDFNYSLNEVSDEILDQTAQLSSLYEELKALKESKELLQTENARLTVLVEELEAKQQLSNEPPLRVDEQLELEKEAKDKSRYEDLLTDHSRLTNQCSDLKEQLRTCANEIDSFKNEAAEWQNYCELARKECSVKNDQISWLTQQAETFKNETELLNSNIADVQTHCERLREEAALKDERISTVVDENVRREEEMESLRNRVVQLEADLQSQRAAAVVTTAEQINQTDDVRGSEQEEIQSLVSRVEELTLCKERLEEEVASSNERIRELSERIQSYESDIEAWKSHLRERTDECTIANERIRLLEERTSELENEVSALRSQLVDLEKWIEEARKEVASKEACVAELTRQSDANADEIQKLKSTIRALDERRNSLRRSLAGILLSENEAGHRQLPDVIQAVEKFALVAQEERSRLELLSEDENGNSEEVDEWSSLVERARALSVVTDEVDKSNVEETIAELNSRLQSYEQQCGELEKRIAELERSLETEVDGREVLKSNVMELEKKLSVVTSERDQVITSLKEKHSENLYYHNELQKMHTMFTSELEKNKDHVQQIEDLKQQLMKNQNVEAELERLREHLLSTEQSYTNELLSCEEQIKELKCKLNEYEIHVKSINAVQTSVNVRTNQITESLQKEAKTLAEEKEKLTVSLKQCQGELRKSIHDAQNLRSALDLFRRNKDSEIFQATEKLQNDVKSLQSENRVLNETILSLQNNLEAVKQSSNEKTELREQIERKTRIIDELEAQADSLRAELSQAEAKIVELKANAENTFKLNLLKNIVLRYITSSTDSMRSQALQILAEVLDFSTEEKRKVKLPVSGDDSKSKTKSSSSNQSLIDEFIRFVEKESDPKDRSASEKKTSTLPNILFSSPSSLPDVMLPTLSQHPVGQNSRHILKDVLQ